MTNVLVLGKGFISDHLPYEKFTDKIWADAETLAEHLIINRKNKPDVIINCAGRTGTPNVDWCESHQSETAEGNVSLPVALAEATKKHGIHMIHIGSGCIFYGESPNINVSLKGPVDTGWKEEDFANPKSFYSKTKYACDLVLGPMSHVSTLRIRMPISILDHSRNLINKLLNYKQVLECQNSVTFISDLVRAVQWTVDNKKTGIYHVTNPEPMTHIELLEEYKKYIPHTYEKISEQKLGGMVIATRSNCVLNSSKIVNEGFNMTPTHEAMRACVKDFVNNKRNK